MRQEKQSQFVRSKGLLLIPLLLMALPLIMGPGRCGVSAGGFFSDLPAPDMRGDWAVAYDDALGIEIDLGGGAVYEGTVTEEGGSFQFSHNGQTVSLDLDCSKSWVVCPSEIWADLVSFDQPRFDTRPHQVEMSVQVTNCANPRLPDENAGECSSNPDDNMPCDQEICEEGDVELTTERAIASISNPVPANPATGSKPDYTIGIFLNGGFAVPTANCALLATSYADADIAYSGRYDPLEPTMRGDDLTNGVVTVDLTGACFWGTYQDEQLKAALLSARVRLTTGFTASRQ